MRDTLHLAPSSWDITFDLYQPSPLTGIGSLSTISILFQHRPTSLQAFARTFEPNQQPQPSFCLPSLGMESRFLVNRDEFHNVQMDIRQVQIIQSSHAERLSRLERRHQEDTALKSVWSNSPFPSALTGTPQHGAYHFFVHFFKA